MGDSMNMPTCHICYNMKFVTWIEFHDHYVENHHMNLSDLDTDNAAEIRRKAIATPLNISGRTKAQIVDDAERTTWLAKFLV